MCNMNSQHPRVDPSGILLKAVVSWDRVPLLPHYTLSGQRIYAAFIIHSFTYVTPVNCIDFLAIRDIIKLT